ncbi:hypothetical protein KIF59_19040 [Enterobacter cloacae subsp. cloacae]|nr:hypothetical protein [Enterobacter cloacae subsp. cloacae]
MGTVIRLHGLTSRFAGMEKPAVAPLNCTIHSAMSPGWWSGRRRKTTLIDADAAGLLRCR